MLGEDKNVHRMVEREIGRRSIDYSKLFITTAHGVVYLKGEVRCLHGHSLNLKDELEIIRRVIRNKQGIRDVHVEDVNIVT